MQNRHGYLPGDCHNKFSMMHQCENLRSASDGAVICLTCNFRIVFYLACLHSNIAFPLVEPPTLQFPYLQFFISRAFGFFASTCCNYVCRHRRIYSYHSGRRGISIVAETKVSEKTRRVGCHSPGVYFGFTWWTTTKSLCAA